MRKTISILITTLVLILITTALNAGAAGGPQPPSSTSSLRTPIVISAPGEHSWEVKNPFQVTTIRSSYNRDEVVFPGDYLGKAVISVTNVSHWNYALVAYPEVKTNFPENPEPALQIKVWEVNGEQLIPVSEALILRPGETKEVLVRIYISLSSKLTSFYGLTLVVVADGPLPEEG